MTSLGASEPLTLGSRTEYESYTCSELHKVHAVLSVKACALDVSYQRTPCDIVAVVDVSGSMAGEKLKLTIHALTFCIGQLMADDRLAIVSFDSEVKDVFPLDYMTSECQAKARSCAKRMRAGSSTNLSGGLFRGIDILQQALQAGAATPGGRDSAAAQHQVRSVLLFTDGQANMGVVAPEQLEDATAHMLGADAAPRLLCFGFGTDHNADLLTHLAERGSGQSFFMQQPDNIPPAFASAAGGLLELRAQNLEVVIHGQPSAQLVKAATGYKQQTLEGGGISVRLGDAFSNETKDLLLEVDVSALPTPQESQPLFSAQARYLDLQHGTMRETSVLATVRRPGGALGERPRNAAVANQMHRVATGMLLDQSRIMADGGNIDGAKSLLQQQVNYLRSQPASEQTGMLIDDLEDAMLAFASHAAYAGFGRKKVSSKTRGHMRQQVCDYSAPSHLSSRSAYMSSTRQHTCELASLTTPVDHDSKARSSASWVVLGVDSVTPAHNSI